MKKTPSMKKPLLDFEGTDPWFEPVRFWSHWAAFYPVSWQGWMVTILIFVPLLIIYWLIIVRTTDFTLALMRFLPFLVIAFIFYDSVTLKRGSYPSWWTEKRKDNK